MRPQILRQQSVARDARPFGAARPRMSCTRVCSTHSDASGPASRAGADPAAAAPRAWRAGAAPSPWRAPFAATACGGLAAAALTLLGGPVDAAELVPFVNEPQKYVMQVPKGWERKDKAGADVLFEDPAIR